MSFRRRISGFVLVLAVAAPLGAQKIPVAEKTLSNGMHLLIVHREGEATVAGGWVAHVGSSNERPGITGISHLFEHMMFKGTPTIGTKDYRKDLAVIGEQELVREEMRQEEAKMRAAYRRGEIDDLLKPENKTSHYRELEKKFDELIRKHAPDGAYQIASVYAWRGEKDRAFEWLERAYAQRDGGLVDIQVDPLVASLHGMPRYSALLHAMKLLQ